MGNLVSIVAVCFASSALLFAVNIFLVPRLECRKTDLVPVVLRSLVLLGGLLILQPQMRSHIFFSFCFALTFDYFYTRIFNP